MKTIEVDEQLYRYIASQTLHIGESASDILRRLLGFSHQAGADVLDFESRQSASENVVVPAQLQSLLDSQKLIQEESAVARFMLVLSALYQDQPDAFQQAADIKGRKRVYFSRDHQTLLSAGNTTKPRHIENTPYWVITNTNTGRKRLILEQLMLAMGYSAEQTAEVCQKI